MKKLALFFAAIMLAANVHAQTLLSHYDFNGFSATNSAGTPGLNGIINGPVVSAAGSGGVANTALQFNGSSTWVEVPSDPRLDLTQWTIMTKVKFTGFNPTNCQVSKIVQRGCQGCPNYYCQEVNDNSFDLSCTIYSPANQQFFGVAAGNPTSTTYLASPSPTLSLNTWYCLTATYGNDTLRTYVDGTLFYENYWPNQYSYTGASLPLYIGRGFGGFSAPYWFNGVIDDVKIWDGALSTAQVLSNCGIGSPCRINDIQYCSSLSTPFTYTFTPSVTLGTANLQWNFGDGSPLVPSVGNAPVTHTFPSGGGSYYICAQTLAPCTPITERCFPMCLSTSGARGSGENMIVPTNIQSLDRNVGEPYPNPTNSVLNVPIEKATGGVKVSVYGVDGKLIFSQQGKVDESSKLFQVNTSSLRTGMYIMEIQVNDQKVTKRFSKL